MSFNLKNPISRMVIKLACKLPVEFVCIICTRNENVVRLKAGEDFRYIVGTFIVFAAIGVLLAY